MYDKEQQQPGDVLMLLEKLSDNDDAVRESSTKRLVELGRQSDENRQIVIAVPKLIAILSHLDPQVRIYASVCLGSIQGAAARQALTVALAKEQDVVVQHEIRLSIAVIDRGN